MADERRSQQDQRTPGAETEPSGIQPGRHIAIDGNEAAASVAYRLSEVIAIYPITPSSTMAELSDEWMAKRRPNIWGTVPEVVEMQSESGAAAAVHGALQAGARATTFTASQGLLLMIPDMYKIAGELLPYVKHVSARAIATHALSIFGDHSDVMACRQTGFAMLASANVQEAHDLAAVAHAATLESRVPFLHFMDGFRTSHEVNTMRELSDADLAALVDPDKVREQRMRRLDPDRPVLRGATANPDTFFQGREVVNPFYADCPAAVQTAMDRLAERTGRRYRLFEYEGHPQAERVVVAMASGAEVAHATVERLAAQGERVGVVKVRLYRPFSVPDFLAALPASVKAIGVLDRTKEPGSVGEPLYLDVVAALQEARAEGLTFGGVSDEDAAGDGRGADPAAVRVIGGRYGLGSKEFDPAMVKAVLDELTKDHPKNHFTVGIDDDLSHTSLDYDESFVVEPPDTVRGIFVALGADGTVGANKNSIKIIGEETGQEAHGYFVYDSKKSGGITVSHLRFGPHRLRTSYLIRQASFVACHHYRLLDKTDVLDFAAPGAVFLLNTPYGPDEVWAHLRPKVQRQIRDKDIDLWVIDAFGVAGELGLGVRINTIMQTCFFAISGVLPRDDAIARIKASIEKTYGRKGPEVVRRNFEAVDGTLARLHQVPRPTTEVESVVGEPRPLVPNEAPEFVREVTAMLMAGEGDRLPVSRHPVDGTWPLETSRYEKRNIALEIPIWDPRVCIQCGKCAFVCPHSTIRTKLYDAALLEGAPADFQSVKARGKQFDGMAYTVQVAPEDCTGCRLCVTTCPGKDRSNPSHKAISMQPHDEHVDRERGRWDFFSSLPAMDRAELDEREVRLDVKSLAVAAAAVRVPRRLRRLRRDPVPAPGHPALRRPHADRLRHRLRLHLRGQPAHPALRRGPQRSRPGLDQLTLREQRRVRPGHAPGGGQADGHGPRAPGPVGGRAGRRVGRRATAGGPERRPRPDRAARTRGGAQDAVGGYRPAGSRGSWAPSRTCWSTEAYGSWAATAGPTTSATGDWTTSSIWAATSTSWCTTPRCTPTRVARCPSRRRWPPSPSSPRQARPPSARTWG